MKKNLFLAAIALCAAMALPAVPSFAKDAKDDVTVKVVMHAPLRVLDPIFTNAYITRNHGYLVFDTLFSLDSEGKPQPQMVNTFKLSPDKLTYTFTLRPGLKFHDGSPVTSDDVIASLQRWAARDALGTRLMAVTEKMAAVDANTFTLQLKKPYGLVLDSLAKPGSPVPFIMPKRLAATSPNEAITEMVGSGPYKFVQADFQPGVKATYLKFADYVPRSEPASNFAGGKVVNIDRLEVVNIADGQTAVNAMRNGEIDFIENVAPDLLSQFDGVKGVSTAPKSRETNMYTLRMNWMQPPFDNVKVRRAAMAALYQLDYLDASIGDPKRYRVCGAVLTCSSPYKSEEGATQIHKPDLAKAKQMLKESGYKGEKVVVLHSTDVRSLVNIAPITAQALRSIGMNVDMQAMDFTTLLARRTKKDPVDKGGWSIFQSSIVVLDLINPVVNPNLDGRGEVGYPGWTKDDTMEGLRDQFASEPDAAKRAQIAQAIQKRAYEQVFYVPLGEVIEYKAFDAKMGKLVDAQLPLFWSSK
jgi:peptide/nickel transport system substrate-binding protein